MNITGITEKEKPHLKRMVFYFVLEIISIIFSMISSTILYLPTIILAWHFLILALIFLILLVLEWFQGIKEDEEE